MAPLHLHSSLFPLLLWGMVLRSSTVDAFVGLSAAGVRIGLPYHHHSQCLRGGPSREGVRGTGVGYILSRDRSTYRSSPLTLAFSLGDSAGEDEPAMDLLRNAVETRKASADEVKEALRYIAEGKGDTTSMEAEDVEGTWELIFSTQLPSGYMPVRELVGFHPSREEASIDTTAGPFPIGGMRGQCWWKGGPENELAFTMGAVKLGPFKIGKDKNDVKTYRFFLNDGKLLAAKSSGGGFTLLSRISEEGS